MVKSNFKYGPEERDFLKFFHLQFYFKWPRHSLEHFNLFSPLLHGNRSICMEAFQRVVEAFRMEGASGDRLVQSP